VANSHQHFLEEGYPRATRFGVFALWTGATAVTGVYPCDMRKVPSMLTNPCFSLCCGVALGKLAESGGFEPPIELLTL
jgi:hypothetical protein